MYVCVTLSETLWQVTVQFTGEVWPSFTSLTKWIKVKGGKLKFRQLRQGPKLSSSAPDRVK